MKILVACEESQAVTIELRKLGHEAYSCDIIECSGGHPEWHIQGDALELISKDCQSFTTMDGCTHTHTKWDMLIAHPPCTYLSNAGACRLYKRIDGKQFIDADRLRNGLDAKEFFMSFYNADIEKIAVENAVVSGLELYKSLAKHKPHGRYGTVYVLTNFNTNQEEDLYRIYKLRDMGFDPYVMVYDKPNASNEVTRLQRWCNNIRIFRQCKKFEDYR